MKFALASILGFTQAETAWNCQQHHQLDPLYKEDTSNKPIYLDHRWAAQVQVDQGTQMYIPVNDDEYDSNNIWCVTLDAVFQLEARTNFDYIGFRTMGLPQTGGGDYGGGGYSQVDSGATELSSAYGDGGYGNGGGYGQYNQPAPQAQNYLLPDKKYVTGLNGAKVGNIAAAIHAGPEHQVAGASAQDFFENFDNLSFFMNRDTGTVTYTQNGVVLWTNTDKNWKTPPTKNKTKPRTALKIEMTKKGEGVKILHKNWEPIYKKAMVEIVKLSDTVRTNGNIIMDLEHQINLLSTQNTDCHKTLSEQTTIIKKNTADVTTCNTHVTAKTTAVNTLQTQSDGCTKKNTDLSNQLTGWVNKWHTCIDSVTQLTITISEKEQRITTLRNNMHGNSKILTQRKEYLDRQIKNLTKEVERFNSQITTLKTSITTTTSHTTELRTWLESATTRVTTYKAAVARLEAYDHALLEKYYHVLTITIRLDHSNLELRKMNLDLQRNYDTVLISDSHLKAENAQLILENTDYENTIRYLKLEEHDSSTTVTITVHHHESDNEKIVKQEETTVTHHTEVVSSLQEEEPKESSIGATGASIIAVSVISLGAGAFLIFKKAFSQKRAGLYHDL